MQLTRDILTFIRDAIGFLFLLLIVLLLWFTYAGQEPSCYNDYSVSSATCDNGY